MVEALKGFETKLRVWYGVWLDSSVKDYLIKLYEEDPMEAAKIMESIVRESRTLAREHGYRLMIDEERKLYFRLACPECGSTKLIEDVESVCTNCGYVLPVPSFVPDKPLGVRGGTFDVEDPTDIKELSSYLFDKKLNR